MKQPEIEVHLNHTRYKVLSLVRMDNGTTLRAFPDRERWPWQELPLSYVIIKWTWESTEPNATLILPKDKKTVSYKWTKPIEEWANDMIARRNAKKVLWQKDPYWKEHEVKWMKKCLKDNEVKTQYKRLRKTYTHDEIMDWCSKYMRDVEDRKYNIDPNNYCHHRFSLYEFLKQSNWFVKFFSK